MSKHRLAACLLALASGSSAIADTRLVRETEALTPEQEQARLHVPEGFEIQLFASEPMINKPINMAFDARGRLWVSSTFEYPYAAAKDRWSDAQGSRVQDSRDAIKILEDTDGDGRADKVTDFADGLNIPTGVLPWHKPEHHAGCIAWSIPNIWYFADTTGDGQADLREVLFGPLGYEKDTHGMCSSFRLGLDGWVYATHGFSNTSTFRVRPANLPKSEIRNPKSEFLEIHSGNVFRFRPDGSAVEKWTSGQVNPFGLAWDRYNNLYSADCHSSPVYQLIRGAHYPSFGKPHDGLGFAPVMCQHTHGSTGICGIVYIDGGVWGPDWDDRVLLGNVVTSKVNLDRVTFNGSTPLAQEEPDFITSDDPWFRPVDLQLGPDGALYIADFYNKIIGHYEVPLDHPGRDKERGRIWRVVRNGAEPQRADFNAMTSSALLDELLSHNLTRRHLALLHFKATQDRPFLLTAPGYATHLMRLAWWTHDILYRQRGKPPFDGHTSRAALRDDSVPEEDKVELLHQLAEFGHALGYLESGDTLHALRSSPPRILLAAVFAAYAHPQSEFIPALLAAWSATPASDEVLRHSLKIALRKCLETPDGFRAVNGTVITEENKELLFDVIASTRSEAAALFLLDQLPILTDPTQIQRALLQIARHGPQEHLPAVMELAQSIPGQPLTHLKTLAEGISERGAVAPPTLRNHLYETLANLLDTLDKQPEPVWTLVPQKPAQPAWSVRPRKLKDGRELPALQSMETGGGAQESRTGVLRSRVFPAPARLSFYLCGHRGPPQEKPNRKNLVRLMSEDGTVLRSAFPPRSDNLQPLSWDLADLAGQNVRLEIVDGDAGKAYAWIGVAGLDPALLSIEAFAAENETRESLRALAALLPHHAPSILRDRLAPFLPPQPAPPPTPVSPEQRAALDQLITTRAIAFEKVRSDPAKGAALFAAHCAACHQIGGEGGLLGPQLDGIGARGVERLCEDILDPNRNVDAHFRLRLITRKDGSTLSGFLKAEAGQVLILADAAGNETRVPKAEVEKDEVLPLSLMPAIFGQTIPETDFHDLLAWLLGR